MSKIEIPFQELDAAKIIDYTLAAEWNKFVFSGGTVSVPFTCSFVPVKPSSISVYYFLTFFAMGKIGFNLPKGSAKTISFIIPNRPTRKRLSIKRENVLLAVFELNNKNPIIEAMNFMDTLDLTFKKTDEENSPRLANKTDLEKIVLIDRSPPAGEILWKLEYRKSYIPMKCLTTESED